MSIRIAAFASGGGTNVQALLDHFGSGPGGEVASLVAVISDREDAFALERARRAGAAARVIRVEGLAGSDVARRMLEVLEGDGVDLITLAGYVKLIPAEVVAAYAGRMLNIHPALLPAFGGRGMYGIRIHRAVLARGCKVTGATVHYVNESYDEGPILCQWPVPVLPGDTAESLAVRVLAVEHRLYPAAAELVARALLAGKGDEGALPQPMPPAGDLAFQPVGLEAPSPEAVRRALGLPV